MGTNEIRFQKVQYYRQIKPPTLKQYLYRRKMAEVMHGLGNQTGVTFDKEINKLIPLTASLARKSLKGLTSDKIADDHADWVSDWRTKYG